MRTIILENSEDENWFSKVDNFVDNHPKGNIFQTSRYYLLFLNSNSAKPIAFIHLNENEDVVGIIIAIIQFQQIPFIKFLTCRSIIFGGPIAENDSQEIILSLLQKYDQYISKKALYTQFRNLNEMNLFHHIFDNQGYVFEGHLNILMDLLKSENQLWTGLHSKRRNEIRRAQREELEFKCIESNEDFERSYEILKSLYVRIKLPLYKKEIFQNAFNQLKKDGFAQFFGVYHKNLLIGTMYTFTYKFKIYNWFAGGDEAYLKYYPNDFLPWKIFLWAKENSCSIFDWGGAGKPGVPYGVRDYKAKFGGEFVNYGRFEKIHQQGLFKFVKTGFNFFRRVKS